MQSTYLHSNILCFTLGVYTVHDARICLLNWYNKTFAMNAELEKTQTHSRSGNIGRFVVNWCSAVNLTILQHLKGTKRDSAMVFCLPPRTGRILAQSLDGLWFLSRAWDTNRCTHCSHWLWFGSWMEGAECFLLNSSGWVHGWMDGWMTGGMNRGKKWTLAGLFILYTYTPIQDICDANSTKESQLYLLGSSLCVYNEAIFVGYLSTLHLIFLL